jgi:hypothetical protein
MVLGVDTVSYGGVEQSVGVAMIADEIVELRSSKLGDSIGAGLRLNAATYSHPSGIQRA